jgi:hypothetical protein
MKIVRMKLTPDDISNPNLRFNTSTDTVQFSPDGGTTWADDPAQDPRHADVFRKPPLTGGAAQCDAAANMAAAMKSQVDNFVNKSGSAALLTAALEVISLFTLGAGILVAAILTVIEVAEGIGSGVVNAAFTSDVYDGLKCIFFCHIGSDGQCSAAQLAAIESDISSLYPGTVATIANNYLNLWGEVGLSNAGVVGTATGDCSGCGCGWCYKFAFADGEQSWALIGFAGANNVGAWTGGGWQVGHDIPNSIEIVQISRTFTAVEIGEVVVTFSAVTGASPRLGIYYVLAGTVVNTIYFGLEDDTTYTSITHVFDYSGTFDQIVMELKSGQFSDLGDGTIEAVQFSNPTGTNPFGTDNC